LQARHISLAINSNSSLRPNISERLPILNLYRSNKEVSPHTKLSPVFLIWITTNTMIYLCDEWMDNGVALLNNATGAGYLRYNHQQHSVQPAKLCDLWSSRHSNVTNKQIFLILTFKMPQLGQHHRKHQLTWHNPIPTWMNTIFTWTWCGEETTTQQIR
jgi:hypothetical protein